MSRYEILNHIIIAAIRLAFFACPVPLHWIFSDQIVRTHFMGIRYFAVGVTIAIIGLLIGGVIECLFPRESVLGGKIATSCFNWGTLAPLGRIEFNIKVAQGKGIQIKDKRE